MLYLLNVCFVFSFPTSLNEDTQNWPLHKKNIFCLRHLAVSEVFVNISAESGHETQTSQSSECTTAFVTVYILSQVFDSAVFVWMDSTKTGHLKWLYFSSPLSSILWPGNLSQCLITKSLKMTLGEEERCYWAGVSLTEVCSPVHLCPSNSCWEPIRWWDTRKVRVWYMWILFILCHLDERLINIMKTRLQSKGVEVLLSACCFDSSLLLRFPRFLHSHLRLDRLKRKERKRGKEVRVWKLRNEKSKCN